MKLAVGEVLVAVAGITGNSMSLTDGDSAVMLTRYDGGEEKINELRKEVENNCDVLEPAPIYPNEEESFWKRKAVQNAILGIYSNLRSYEYRQLLLEKIRLTGKTLMNTLRPSLLRMTVMWPMCGVRPTLSSATPIW